MAHTLSFVIETKLGIPKATASGELSDEQISRIEAVVKDPVSNGIPQYMINRNKDMETGKSLHLVSNDLIFNTRQDVSRDVANGTWRGFRHQYGQKVRGQHTRSTGRTGVTVGVTKKKEMKPGGPAAKAAGPAKKEEQAEKKAEKK
jgi:small subunit ribosomal protein S13